MDAINTVTSGIGFPQYMTKTLVGDPKSYLRFYSCAVIETIANRLLFNERECLFLLRISSYIPNTLVSSSVNLIFKSIVLFYSHPKYFSSKQVKIEIVRALALYALAPSVWLVVAADVTVSLTKAYYQKDKSPAENGQDLVSFLYRKALGFLPAKNDVQTT